MALTMSSLPVSPREVNGADIHDDLVPYLHRKLSKNKWTSKKVAKQFRNRHSKGKQGKHSKNNFHKSQIKQSNNVIPSQTTKNKSHRRRVTNNIDIKSQTYDILDNYQSDLELILTENIDGIYGNDDMVLDKDLLIFDSPKRRWRNSRTSRKKSKSIIPTQQEVHDIPNSPITDSDYKSDSYGLGSVKSICLSPINSNNNSFTYAKSIHALPTPTKSQIYSNHTKIAAKYASINNIAKVATNTVKIEIPAIIETKTKTNKPLTKMFGVDDDDSDSSSDSSSQDFVTNAFKNNNKYNYDSDNSDDDDYVPPPPKNDSSLNKTEEINVDLDGFDVKEELKSIGLLNDAGEEVKGDDDEKLEEQYVEQISNIEELNNYAPIEGLASRCSYNSYNKDDETTQMDPKTLKKVFNEIRIDLPKNLTVQWNGSMFVRFDEENPRFLQALLTGLKDTPYENGMFLFDIYLHKDYPNSPLHIKHVTKGGSTVYGDHTPGGFSPNLHRESGKVCLSLLGTWGTNQWDSKTSNIYQVLSSILWMILGAQWAYYMEPGDGGWEGTCNMNESDPSKHSTEVVRYNYEIIEKCMKYAMLETIKTPYVGFEDVIKTHFKLKRKEILGNILNKWIKDSPNITKKKALVALYNSLKEEFDKL